MHLLGWQETLNYRKRARKEYLNYARSRKHTAKKTRKAIQKQLGYLKRDLDSIDGKLSMGKVLQQKQQERLEYHSFDAYNEAGNLQMIAERFREREGHYPKRILADKIYRNRENLQYCKERGIRLTGPPLGRPKKIADQAKKQSHIDECERVEVERCFSLAKRKCGMGRISARLEETAAHTVAMSVLVLNLRKIQLALYFAFRKKIVNYSVDINYISYCYVVFC